MISLFLAMCITLPHSLAEDTTPEPFTIAVVIDPKAKAFAANALKEFKKTPPFNELGEQLQILEIEGDPALMDCKNNTYGIPRLLNCSYSYSYKIRSETRAHRVAFVTAAAEGGAGGDPAIVGAGSPLYTLLHEFAHSFGVADEYKYSASEAQIYCVPPRSNPNSVSFSPLPSYASDVEARTLHRGQIPWFSKIGESTLITSGQSLGTMPGMFPKDQAALYPAMAFG